RPRPLTGGLSKVMTAMPSRSVVVTAMSLSAPWREGNEWKGRSWAAPRALCEAPAKAGERRHLLAEAQRFWICGHSGARARADALQDCRQPEPVVGQAEVPERAAAAGAPRVGPPAGAVAGEH